jgi:NAD(P)-dependent dehydrogenase (short-subunit alcohol dehydrogenase family)
VLFSSIAAAAPRVRNVAYGAAKAVLEHYGRSLQHRLAGGPMRLQVYALGNVDTGSRRVAAPAPSRRPEPHSPYRRRCPGDDRRFTYLPRYWRVITLGLRHLPWPIYRRPTFSESR